MSKEVASVPHVKLRKFGGRIVAVVERNAHLGQTIAVAGVAAVTASEAFNSAYDAARAFESVKKAEMDQGRDALQRLDTLVRAWFAIVQSDIPSVGTEQFDGKADDPELLLADAGRLVEVVQTQGGSLPYAEQLVGELTAASEQADAEWTQARDAMVKLQELRAVVRGRAVELQKRLVAFRQAFRIVVGTRHHDYQRLRVARIDAVDEDEAVVAPEPEVGETAGAETTSPTNGHGDGAQPQVSA